VGGVGASEGRSGGGRRSGAATALREAFEGGSSPWDGCGGGGAAAVWAVGARRGRAGAVVVRAVWAGGRRRTSSGPVGMVVAAAV
jgi:hypothetical protein